MCTTQPRTTSLSFSRLVLSLLVAMGCSDIGNVQVHPILEAPSGATNIGLGDGPGFEVPYRFNAELERLRSPYPVWSAGSWEAPQETAFGRITDISADPPERVFVLDDLNHRIGVFSWDGQFQKNFGGEGDGPSEFRESRFLSIPPSGDLILGGFRGIMRFSLSNDEFVFAERMAPGEPPSPADLCLVGDSMFTVSSDLSGSGLVAKASFSEGVLTRFGDGYRHGAAITREHLSSSLIACDGEKGIVVTAFQYLPLVRGFSMDGSVLWQ